MATLEELKAARDLWLARLVQAAQDETAAGGLPNSQMGGVDHAEFCRRCREMVEWYDRQIQAREGPIEIESFGEV